jgi:hypothetical protein
MLSSAYLPESGDRGFFGLSPAGYLEIAKTQLLNRLSSSDGFSSDTFVFSTGVVSVFGTLGLENINDISVLNHHYYLMIVETLKV